MGGTPASEISKQHEEALGLVKKGLACNPIRYHDEIPLDHKQIPTSELGLSTDGGGKEEQHAVRESKEEHGEERTPVSSRVPSLRDECISVSSRGYVDVSLLQGLVEEGYNKIPSTTKEESGGSGSGSGGGGNGKKRWTASDVKSKSNLWDEANAAVNNVSIFRPSHDSWGIGKIVLVFCDDYLRQIYEMPWWHLRPDIRAAVRPILEVLQLATEVPPLADDEEDDNNKNNNALPHNNNNNNNVIVRMLLASLPPGVTIPVHHDTGEWVKYTHRVHVPIIVSDPPNVLFRCGVTVQNMNRVDCRPGHVFELNNQAKHAVSNCSTDHRVHLILDYIDRNDLEIFREKNFGSNHKNHKNNNQNNNPSTTTTAPRVKLHPGERLLQTRRSIDRLTDRGTRKEIPYFLILGAQKAGTTSLYEYMMQHPLIVRPKRRETHCLDWRWPNDEQIRDHHDPDNTPTTTNTPTAHTKHRSYIQNTFFQYKQLQYYPSLLIGDSTPSYLLDSVRVIPRLKQCFDWDIKFCVILRDPVRRAMSHYAMVTSPNGTPEQLRARGDEWRGRSFDSIVREDLHNMKRCGLIPYWDIDKGVHDETVFQEFVGSTAENQAWEMYLQTHVPLHTGSHSLISRGLYELNLRPWFQAFDDNNNSNNNNNNNDNDNNNDHDLFLILQLEKMLQPKTNETMKLVWEHLNIPEHTIVDTAPKNTREYDPMDSQMKQYLQAFYKPHNQQLGEILRQRIQRTSNNNNNNDANNNKRKRNNWSKKILERNSTKDMELLSSGQNEKNEKESKDHNNINNDSSDSNDDGGDKNGNDDENNTFYSSCWEGCVWQYD